MNFNSTRNNSTLKVRTVITKTPAPASNSLHPSSARSGPPPDRFKLSATTPKSKAPATRKPPQTSAQRALSAATGRGTKRKSATPQPEGPLFSDDDGDSSDIGTSDSDVSRKRIKSSVSSVESSGPRRRIAINATDKNAKALRFVHGEELTSGDQKHKFKIPWGEEKCVTVSLQYPSKGGRERFQLKWPKHETDDYKPMEDIVETIKHICLFYIPEELSEKYSSDETGFGRLFNRAWQRQDIYEFTDIVKDFNAMLKPLIEDGTIQRELGKQSTLHLDLVKRILDQTYARTVSPRVETLKAYTNGTDNVYGELFPRLISKFFRETHLNHEQCFVDIGSGVGNVVLQAALEVGCESWGIEMMENPCHLAELQAAELPARARLWGLNVGDIYLVRDDVRENEAIRNVLKRADVVLVNNQAFTPQLNADLLAMFLDLREGCQIVSLKPFVPEGHKMTARYINDIANLFTQRRSEYFSDSVSWTNRSGYFYYATKDSRPLQAFKRRNKIQ